MNQIVGLISIGTTVVILALLLWYKNITKRFIDRNEEFRQLFADIAHYGQEYWEGDRKYWAISCYTLEFLESKYISGKTKK